MYGWIVFVALFDKQRGLNFSQKDKQRLSNDLQNYGNSQGVENYCVAYKKEK